MPLKTSLFVLISLVFAGFSSFSQNASDTLHSSMAGLISPLGIPLVLSGNFGEFRGNHFHTGLDFKTQGREGFPVLAVADGVVARVKVRPGGYGNALYLKHKNGSTSVYAHLSLYSPAIEAWLLKRQYASRSFGIDACPVTSVYFTQGDTIGWSGNSGSSGGPHLHFEMRDEHQKPVNPLQWDLAIFDSRSPEVGRLWVVPVDSRGLENRDAVVKVNKGDTVTLSAGYVNLCVEAKDRLDGASNVCGVYKLEVEIDGAIFSSYSIDTLDFSVNKDMNAHAYYPEWKSSKTQIHRVTPLPGNRLNIYQKRPSENLMISAGETKLIHVKCWDAHGNLTTSSYSIYGDINSKESVTPATHSADSNSKKSVAAMPNRLTELSVGGMSVVWPKYSFYSREIASLSVMGVKDVAIGPADAPLAKPFTLTLDCPQGECDYWVAERRNEKGKRAGVEVCECVGTQLAFSSSKMGVYHLLQDTVPPRVLPKHSASPILENGDLVFHVEDALSGVAQVKGFIDDQWVLFHWDPKRKTAMYHASDLHHISGGTQTVKFVAQDEVGLISEWSGKVTFP